MDMDEKKFKQQQQVRDALQSKLKTLKIDGSSQETSANKNNVASTSMSVGSMKFSKKKTVPIISRKRAASFEITNLPRELLLHIFSYLDVPSTPTCAQVCSLWNTIALDNELWKTFYQQHILYNTQTPKQQRLGTTPTLPSPINVARGWWKNSLFKKCKLARNKRFMALDKVNAYTGITNHMDEILWKLGCKFELCLTCRNGNEISLIQTKRKSLDSTTIVQWSPLDGWPELKEIKRVKIFSLTPLLFGKDKKHMYESPVQRSLLMEEEMTKLTHPLSTSDQVSLYRTKQNILFALWTKGGQIAFVAYSLHHHKLLSKCLKSTSEKIYNKKHEVVADDIDTLYGLHGYKCHVDLHTMNKSLWNEKFNCLYSEQSQVRSETPMKDIVTFEPRGYEMRGRLLSALEIKWRTEIFKGSVPNVIWTTLTMCDINEEVLWNVSVPVSIQVSQKNGDFEFEGDTKVMNYEDECGKFEIVLNDDGGKALVITKILLKLRLEFINKWFGMHHKST